jgi:diacylglycerol kinase family enzyme
MLPVVRRGEHSGLPEITFYRAKSVHIESRSLVNMQVDGETTCAATFDATILPGALCVRV